MSMRSMMLATISMTLSAASAQAIYPEKPVKLIVPFAAGGGGDVNGRLIAQKLSEKLKQSFVVENRVGAGGNIGTIAMKNAPADGYTLLLATAATVINPHLYANAGYSAADITPVASWSQSPLLILASTKLPVNDLNGYVDYAKKNPGKLSFASGGTGIITHMVMERFKQTSELDVLHVPFQGQAPAVMAVASGQVDSICDSVASAAALVKAGKLKPLAVTSSKTIAMFPEIKTVVSQGFPELEANAWYGLVAPAGVSTAIVEKLNKAVREILADPETAQRLASVGAEPFSLGNDDFKNFMTKQSEIWSSVINKTDMKLN